MNEVLIRRLIGALTLLLVALGIGFLLPSPEPPRPEDGLKRVTIDLQSAEIVETLPVDPDSALPPVIAAPEPLPESAVLVEAAGDAESEAPAPTPKGSPTRPSAAPPAVASVEAPAARSQPKAPPVQLKATETLKLPSPAATSAAPKPKPAPPPSAVQPPQKAAAPASPAGTAKLPPEKPAVVATSPAVTSESPKPAAAPMAGGRWYVQVGSFSDISNARDAEGKLRSAGLPTVLSPIETSKGTLYRVRVAPLSGEAQAVAARSKVQQLGFAQAIAKQE